jgi:hypothetical protein
MKTIKTYKTGNSMTDLPTVAIFQERDGTFTAITYTTSRSFKTLVGAERFMAKRGF